MRYLVLTLLFPTLALAVERSQVRQWLVDNNHIATVADDSWDAAIPMANTDGTTRIVSWPTAQLGAEPQSWPDFATAQAALLAAEAALPQIFTKRVQVMDADLEVRPDGDHGLILSDTLGNRFIVTVTTNGTLFATQISASPEVDFATRQARLTAERTALAAIATELNLTTNQVQAVKDYFNANVDTLFPTMNANQRKFLKVQQALLKALVKERLKEVR